MKKNALLFIVFLLSFSIYASAQGWQWGIGSSNLNGTFTSIPMTSDHFGNVFCGGSVSPDTTGLFYTSYYGPLALHDSSGRSQLVVVKANATGSYIWVKGTQNGNAAALSMATDKSGNLYVLGEYDTVCSIDGHTLFNTSDLWMYFITKFDSAGNVIWTQNITSGAILSPDNGTCGGVGVDDSGNAYVTGTFINSSVTLGSTTITNTGPSGTTDLFIVKYTPSGSVVWTRDLGNISNDYISGITVFPNGDFYISGKIGSGTLTFADTTIVVPTLYLFIAKYDGNGNENWIKGAFLDGVGDCINSTAGDIGYNIYLTGGIGNTFVFGSDTVLHSVSGTNPFILKYDSSGHLLWKDSVTSSHSSGGNMAWSITIDSCENTWICGNMQWDTMNFDGHILPPPTNPSDAFFIAEYDMGGAFQTGFTLNSGHLGWNGIAVDNNGYFYLGACYTFDTLIIASDTLYPTSGEKNLLIAKYQYNYSCSKLSSTELPATPVEIKLFPNPSNYECTIHSETPFPPGSKAELYDITGRLINTWSLSGNNTEISLVHLTPGMYQFRIYTAGNSPITKKLVIMK